MMNDLCATSLSRCCSVYFVPIFDSMAAGMDVMLQSWDHPQACTFPSFVMGRQVLNKVRESQGTEVTLIAPFWPTKEWFPDLLTLLSGPPIWLPLRRDLLRQPISQVPSENSSCFFFMRGDSSDCKSLRVP